MLTTPTQTFTKGMIIPMEGGGGPISFQWNPKTINRDKAVNWAKLKPIAREQEILQYGIGLAQVVTFEIDVSEAGGSGSAAKSYIDGFIELTKPTVGGEIKRPPKLKLILGETLRMECVLSAVTATYGPMFHPGTLGPQQSKVRLTFIEFK